MLHLTSAVQYLNILSEEFHEKIMCMLEYRRMVKLVKVIQGRFGTRDGTEQNEHNVYHVLHKNSK